MRVKNAVGFFYASERQTATERERAREMFKVFAKQKLSTRD